MTFILPSILCLTYSKICIKQVYTEGRLIVEFTFDDMMRIRSWHFAVRNHRELIPRNILAMQDPGMVESLSKNITRQGLTNTTLNYLRVIAIFWYLDKYNNRKHKNWHTSKVFVKQIQSEILFLSKCHWPSINFWNY